MQLPPHLYCSFARATYQRAFVQHFDVMNRACSMMLLWLLNAMKNLSEKLASCQCPTVPGPVIAEKA
jgi:hypothetical protein